MSLSSCGGVGGVHTCVAKIQAECNKEDDKNQEYKASNEKVAHETASGEVTYRHDLCVTILSFKDILLYKCTQN